MKKVILVLLSLILAFPVFAQQIIVAKKKVESTPAGHAVEDTFSSDTSANYTAVVTNSTLQIKSGYAIGGTDWMTDVVSHNTTVGSADQSVQVDQTKNIAGPIARVNTTNHTYYFAYISGTYVRLDSCAEGTCTNITSYDGSYALATTTYTLKLTTKGSTIKVFVDGLEHISVSDSTYTTGNYCGLAAYTEYDDGGRLDNFTCDTN